MLKGYTGKILKIYLGNSNIEVKKLDEETLKRYIGGSGLAARIVYDTTLLQTPALSPENHLVFMTGPFTGTKVPTSGRHSIAAKSPLTGIWGESDVGGSWGFSLKNAGYDGIIFTGISERPVYVWIHYDKVELRDASFLWGMDTYKVETILKTETDRDASVACIGPAGESLVKFSAIMHDGKHARAAGRCGLGAVMGAKRLKAVVVKGDRKLKIADEKGLLNAIRDSIPGMVKKTEHLRKYGTSGSVEVLEEMGDLPIKNWQERTWQEGASRISGVRMVDTIYSDDYYCKTCVIGCGKKISITGGRYAGVEGAAAEHETVARLQDLMCMFDSLKLCKFSLFGGISATDLAAYLHCITGCDMDLKEFMKIGDRIFTLKRLYNCKCGIGRQDDILPPRLLQMRRGDKGSADYIPDLGKVLDEYYQYRGWGEDGIPSEEKIREVGLDDV